MRHRAVRPRTVTPQRRPVGEMRMRGSGSVRTDAAREPHGPQMERDMSRRLPARRGCEAECERCPSGSAPRWGPPEG